MPTLLVFLIAALLSVLLSKWSYLSDLGVSALALAIILGVGLGHCPFAWRAGAENHCVQSRESPDMVNFCRQYLLKVGIVLFGFSLDFNQIIAMGWEVLLIDVIIIASIFSIGFCIGTRLLKIPSDLVILISAGSAICGAAAILATESVIKTRQQHVVVAIACVVVFGSISMISYPIILHVFNLDVSTFGIYIGSTAHEVAQAVAAGEGINQQVMNDAIVVKLIRVMLLAPFIWMLQLFLLRGTRVKETVHCISPKPETGSTFKVVVPWFVFGFILTAGLNSLHSLPEMLKSIIMLLSQLCLSIAMVALGFQTKLNVLKQAGIAPLLLGFILFIILLVGGYFLHILIL
jgi:uncharacterized integral membrane protein (TIGR00698 family)